MAGVYVHIPFCAKKCHYCDFYSGPLKVSHVDYVNNLVEELDAKLHLLKDGVSTVYVGGGTPSALEPRELRRLLGRLEKLNPEEFTVEVNPEDVDAAMVKLLVDSSVNRVSMGVQSFVDDELRSVGRRHSAFEAQAAAEALRNGGIKNVSLDLIYGLPGQTEESWRYSLDKAMQIAPEHLSCYMLSYEPGTLLHTRLNAGRITETDEETIARMYRILCESAAREGYEHYEISNFAKKGYRSRHNSSYWKFVPYLGIGAGAHSFIDGKRYSNPTNIRKYMADCVGAWGGERGEREERETKDEENPYITDAMNEYLMVGLRTMDGVDMEDFSVRFGNEAAAVVWRKVNEQTALGNVALTEKGFRIPEEKWLVSNSIIVGFFW